jgi:lipoprotein-anchoring transpeptidase ErfK/SrfK
VVNLLARAYRQRGIARQEAIKMNPAKADLEMALALEPNDEKAQKHLAQVKYVLSKKIEIDISQQRLYAYEGDKLVYKWRVSTGLRGRDTATGHFYVLDKIPMAYSRVWRLKMPYWLGIYWVQGIENGIHALPIRPNGSIMWGGLLGQRASYGCVILSKSAAKTLYNWANIGTPVHIHN